MKKNLPNPKANKNILFLTYLLVGVFVCMLGYFAYFIQFQREDVINNSYNARLDRLGDRITRGEILSRDGRSLAVTVPEENGTEKRLYPYGPVFAHVVGYSTHGKTGLEALANYYLLSSHANLLERTVNEISDRKSPGDRVITTLDADLQQIAYAALGDRKGAVVVMEPDTGKILAMVSKPVFDPNSIGQDWEMLTAEENDNAQLLNRVCQGLYPPGSTFKIVTALEYIREHPADYRDYTFDCNGVYVNGEYSIRCYHSNVHGVQDLSQAFANSCNGAFSRLGLELNLNRMHDLSEELLFNRELPISLPYRQSSYTMNGTAGTWEILQTSIGQGSTQMTPMHNVMLTAAIANGGVLMKPYLIDRVETDTGEEVKKFMPETYQTLMSAVEADALSELMRKVVTEGTGSGVRTDAYTVAGKTGSAEFQTGKETHAWFTGFAPVENPQLAVTVIVEEGGSGGQVAAPVARSIFDAYFSR